MAREPCGLSSRSRGPLGGEPPRSSCSSRCVPLPAPLPLKSPLPLPS
eukprot:CAMPEP_0183459874 /NCGR_PEP_ID=MMETSP0370-20130417/136475_1 /TAXON_ID=268820 /ORGANISM="Peridinium aciculiferum, Strain PAER-2" /LENGTH=46 /DNA_ID= /DNA_START= /DNA_END= /DNA_ORIENTATION=